MGSTACCANDKDVGMEVSENAGALSKSKSPGIVGNLDEAPVKMVPQFDESAVESFERLESDASYPSAGPSSVFMKELYPGLAAEVVAGHRPQVMFSGHVKPGFTPEEVVTNLMSRGYRAMLNIQEISEPEFLDLDAASTAQGLLYIHIPVPSCDDAAPGQMHEEKLTLELARQIGIVMLVLPRPLMIMSTQNAKRASAVWFFDYVAKKNLSSAQVMMLTASAGMNFASSPPLLYWVGRFMMMVDAERAHNRMVYGDLKFDQANRLDAWDPNAWGRQISSKGPNAQAEPDDMPKKMYSRDNFNVPDGSSCLTRVTGPDGKIASAGDTLSGFELPGDCPFQKIVFPGFTDAGVSGSSQCTFGVLRMSGFAKHKGAAWLDERKYRSVLNLGHSEDIDYVDFGKSARELGLQYMNIPVQDPELNAIDYSLNLARILALTILGMPRPLMIVSGSMKRASAAWTMAYATRWDLGSEAVEKLARSDELNFTKSPKLQAWVNNFMKVADAQLERDGKVLGFIEITGQKLPQWHLDLSKKASK